MPAIHRPTRAIFMFGLAAVLSGCGNESDTPSVPTTSANAASPAAPVANRPTLPGWGIAEAISARPYSLSDPYIAGNDRGDVFAAWTEWQPEDVARVFVNRFVPGSGWEGPRTIGIGNPRSLAVDGNGNAFVVSVTDDGRNWTVRRFDVRSGWSSLLDLPNTAGADCAISPTGAALVAWADGEVVWTRDFDPVSGWAEMEPVARRVAGEDTVRSPRALLDARGGALVTWEQGFTFRRTPPYGYPRWVGRRPGGPWRHALDLGDLGWPSAFDDAGRAVAVWYDAQRQVNRYAVFTAADGPLEPSDVGTPAGFYPRHLATNRAGTRVLVLDRTDDDRIAVTTLAAGTGWAPVEIVRGGSGSARGGIDAADTPLVVWSQFSPTGGTEPWARVGRIASTGPIVTNAGPRTCPDHITAGASALLLAVDAAGNGVAVWTDNDCDRRVLRASRYPTPLH
jgi:hypothetical protein